MTKDINESHLKNLQRKLLFKILPAGLSHVAAQNEAPFRRRHVHNKEYL